MCVIDCFFNFYVASQFPSFCLPAFLKNKTYCLSLPTCLSYSSLTVLAPLSAEATNRGNDPCSMLGRYIDLVDLALPIRTYIKLGTLPFAQTCHYPV
jgi:hypothetical protein